MILNQYHTCNFDGCMPDLTITYGMSGYLQSQTLPETISHETYSTHIDYQ